FEVAVVALQLCFAAWICSSVFAVAKSWSWQCSLLRGLGCGFAVEFAVLTVQCGFAVLLRGVASRFWLCSLASRSGLWLCGCEFAVLAAQSGTAVWHCGCGFCWNIR